MADENPVSCYSVWLFSSETCRWNSKTVNVSSGSIADFDVFEYINYNMVAGR
jgi:hypothetical protein